MRESRPLASWILENRTNPQASARQPQGRIFSLLMVLLNSIF